MDGVDNSVLQKVVEEVLHELRWFDDGGFCDAFFWLSMRLLELCVAREHWFFDCTFFVFILRFVSLSDGTDGLFSVSNISLSNLSRSTGFALLRIRSLKSFISDLSLF